MTKLTVCFVNPINNDLSESRAELKSGYESLNSKLSILESRNTDNGRALKVYAATENLIYGCWGEGLYTYPGYHIGAPNDWPGTMLVAKHTSGYIKTAFSADCKVYMMRQKQDGTVEQSWISQ